MVFQDILLFWNVDNFKGWLYWHTYVCRYSFIGIHMCADIVLLPSEVARFLLLVPVNQQGLETGIIRQSHLFIKDIVIYLCTVISSLS